MVCASVIILFPHYLERGITSLGLVILILFSHTQCTLIYFSFPSYCEISWYGFLHFVSGYLIANPPIPKIVNADCAVYDVLRFYCLTSELIVCLHLSTPSNNYFPTTSSILYMKIMTK